MNRISLAVTVLLLTAFTTHAQMRGGSRHRPAPPSEVSLVQRLMNQNQALQEEKMKLAFCVRGLSSKIIQYGSTNFAAGGAFAQARYRDYDVSNAERQRVIDDIIQRCAPTHIFTGE